MTRRAEEGTVFWKYPHTHTNLLPFDLLSCEVVTLHRVAPALAVASARIGRGLGAGPQRGQCHRSRLGAKTDGALQGDEERSVQNKKKWVTCAATFTPDWLACRRFEDRTTY